MTAIDRVDPAITVFFKVRSSDTIVSIPENMIVAAVIKNTDPTTRSEERRVGKECGS